jgi:hypothetical protein
MSRNEPLAFEPKDLGAERPTSEDTTADALCPFGATAEFVLPANQRNWSRLRFAISTFSTAAANLLELANGCSVQKTRPRYGSGAGSPLTCQLLHDDPIKLHRSIFVGADLPGIGVTTIDHYPVALID